MKIIYFSYVQCGFSKNSINLFTDLWKLHVVFDMLRTTTVRWQKIYFIFFLFLKAVHNTV